MSIEVAGRTFPSVDEAEKLLIHAATQYDKEGFAEDFDGVEISDPDYDALHRYVKKHKPDSEAFKGTSPSQHKASGATVKHDPPMISIDKADGEPEEKEAIYHKWLADCAKRLGVPESELDVVQSFKRDGIALRINYVKGKLVSAGLRPRDGVNGTDVTRHMKYITGVPQKLPKPYTLSLNGEIECHFADFEAVNKDRDEAGEDLYKNPRNYTAGCLGRDDPEENKNSRLRIAFYSITGFDESERHYKTEIERAKWATSPEGLNLVDPKGKGYFVQVRPHEFKHLAMMEDHAAKLPYYTDGVVLKLNSLDHQDELGHSGDDTINPLRAALAWKFEAERAEATIKELEWNASRTGRVVPKAIFEQAVTLADTEVSRATVNNYGWAEKHKIGVGTVVQVKKAGDIIPNVCGVISGEVKKFVAPSHCPACKGSLVVEETKSGNKDLMCKNPDCGAKHSKGWVYFVAKMGGKGLGLSKMLTILNSGKVRTMADLYDLTVPDLTAAGFSERQATLALATIYSLPEDKDNDKLLKAIEQARGTKQQMEAWKFFAALGIKGASESTGKAMMDHFKDFGKIREATAEELEDVNGIGPVTAGAVHDYFTVHADTVDKLLERVELLQPKVGKLTGKNFCLTGSFTLGKKHYQQLIEDGGGNVQGSVGKTTHYLLQQHGKTDGTPSDKEQKAAKFGTAIISVADLEKML